jgi:hypothetical protein
MNPELLKRRLIQRNAVTLNRRWSGLTQGDFPSILLAFPVASRPFVTDSQKRDRDEQKLQRYAIPSMAS